MPNPNTKGISVHVDRELHAEITAYLQEHNMKMADFITIQDGNSDHVGIVEKVEGGRVYTIEGNSGDACERNSYPVGNYQIMGYGMPNLL